MSLSTTASHRAVARTPELALPRIPERVAQVGAGFAAIAIVLGAVRATAGAGEATVFLNFRGALALYVMGALAITLVPSRLAGAMQSTFLVATFALLRVNPAAPLATLTVLALTGAGALALWKLPLERAGVKKAGIALATLGLIAASFLFTDPLRRISLAALALQVASGCEAFSTRPRRTLGECLRALTVGLVPNVVPIDDALKTDRTADCVLRGAIWIALALFLQNASVALTGAAYPRPISAALSGDVPGAVLLAFAFWIQLMFLLGSELLLAAGALRLLGIPVRAPMNAPWLATNFSDYWKRANTWRYQMLSEVYFRNFVALRGPWMPAGVVAVFLLSGLMHTQSHGFGAPLWLRWTLDGVITAATICFLQRRARARIGKFVTKGEGRKVPAFWTRHLKTAACASLVIASHGFIFALYLPAMDEGYALLNALGALLR